MRIIICLICLLFGFNTFASNETPIKKKKPCQLRQTLVANAKQYLGTSYKYGGSDSNGFDCSGFIYHQYKKLNIDVPRTTKTQISGGKKAKLKKVKVGDVVIFTGSNKRKRKAGHAGIVCKINKKGDFDFIHASSSKGVVISNIKESYYKQRFLQVRNFIGKRCR